MDDALGTVKVRGKKLEIIIYLLYQIRTFFYTLYSIFGYSLFMGGLAGFTYG